MNSRAIFAIARKDLKVVLQNKGVIIPIIVIMVIVFGIIPWMIGLGIQLLDKVGVSVDAINSMLTRVAPALLRDLSGYNDNQTAIMFILMYMMEPLFMLFPLMVPLVFAADSFAGEKERKTLEALLYTPTTDQELFIAKVLAGWLTSIVIAWLSFVLYTVMVNAAAWPHMHAIFFPNATWLVIVFWVIPGLPGVALGLMVLISSRAQGSQDANQLGSLVMIPIILLIMAQWSGLLFFDLELFILIGSVIWLMAALLIWLGSRSFHRDRILTT